MSALRYIFSFVFIFFVYISTGFTEECVLPNDIGSVYTIIVPANPPLSTDGGYSSTSTLQRSAWIDSKVFTNGDQFYFEIEGAWTPWYGNFETKVDSSGNSLSVKTSESDFCILETLNRHVDGKPEVIGINGEFDYTSSAYKVTPFGDTGYNKIILDPFLQKPCWLTAGEGLYIAFFGKSGQELPELATHLKSASIVCDEEYKKDRNGDGLFTLNECINSGGINMAYYTAGGARCNRDYYHPNGVREGDGSTNYPLGVFDCYDTYAGTDGLEKKIDKTIFVFRANTFYKNKFKERVSKAERIKFVIYDKYYGDNSGQYVIKMYGGVSDMKDPGVIEKILGDLENVFVGSRDENGVNSGGILKQFYTYILKDTIFAWSVRMMLVLYMAFLGFQFAIGSLEYKTKELMTILLKLTFVLGFTSINSWNAYDYFVVRFFVDGFGSIISMIGNISHSMYDSSANVSSGLSMSSKFAFIDEMITFLFSSSVTKKIQGLFFGVWFGFIVIPIIYILAIYYIYQLVNAIFPYIIMLIQAVLALAVGPIFISFYLFKATEHMFKNWLAFVGARFINMAFLFLILFMFSSLIRQQFLNLLSFEVCKIPFWQAIASEPNGSVNKAMEFFSFGLKVWDAKWSVTIPEPNFLAFCISLLFIGVLVYLFGMIAKKIPTIVDSMIDIGGEAGGGLDKSGNSKFGAKLEGTFDSLNKTFKTQSYDPKTGKKGSKNGVFSFNNIKHGMNKALYGLTDRTAGDIKNKVTSSIGELGSKGIGKITKAMGFSGNVNVANAIEGRNIEASYLNKGLTGQDLVSAASKDYKEYLQGKGYEKEEIDRKFNAYKDDLAKRHVEDPIRNEFKKTSSDIIKSLEDNAKKTGQNYNRKMVDDAINSRMSEFINKEFALKNSAEADQYNKIWKNSYYESSFRSSVNANPHFDRNSNDELDNSSKLYAKGDMSKGFAKEGGLHGSGEDKKLVDSFKGRMEEKINELRKGGMKESDIELLEKEKNRLLEQNALMAKPEFKDCMKKADDNRKNSLILLEKLSKEKDAEQIAGIQRELRELSKNDKQNAEEMQALLKDIKENTDPKVDDKSNENGSVNLLLGGIDSKEFGLKGFTGIGLGEDNKDPLGFGSGAGAAVLGADFKPAETEDKTDPTIKLLNENKLRVAQQQKKILAFQIAQAEVAGDAEELARLKEEKKANEQTIRIVTDDLEQD